MRLLNSPLQIKSFLIPQAPNLFLKAVLYHHMLFIASQVLASSYWYGAAELAAFEMLTSKVPNAKLYTIELGYRDFAWKIKHRFKLFQALYQEVLIFKALLKPPFQTHMEELLICSLFATHVCSPPAQHRRLVQKSHETLSKRKDKIDFNEMKRLLNLLPSICECSFLSWGFSVSLRLTLISFSSAARKNTACSRRKWKFIYITRPLKDFKTQLPAKWNQAQCEWVHIWGVGN